MSDATKPPKRILIPRRCEIQYSWQEEGYDHPIRIVSDEYILASSLPGTPEQIGELVKRCDRLPKLGQSTVIWQDLLDVAMDIRRALAALKKEEKP